MRTSEKKKKRQVFLKHIKDLISKGHLESFWWWTKDLGNLLIYF